MSEDERFDFVVKCWENDCSFTGTTGTVTHMSLATMVKLLDELPKTMIKAVRVLPCEVLSEGTIVISQDLAKVLEEAMGE